MRDVRLLSHVDVRVRDRAASGAFYDTFLTVLGAVRRDGEQWTTWALPPRDAPDDWRAHEWFAIVEDSAMIVGPTRVAFAAPSRGTVDAIATYLTAIGARNIEMPHVAYAPDAYACFFDDLDGNHVEIVCLD